MRSNEPRSLSSEKTRQGTKGQSSSHHHGANDDMRSESPMEVRVRNAAPPDPELLSKIGCRCLVIDFPGVLYENISVNYTGGFVRVEGKRTVGRVKSFRKRFPINHEQVVTKMLSAFLCQGVLVIVAPTKVAAAMAAAAIVAAQLLAKGYSFEKRATPRECLLLTLFPWSTSERPSRFLSTDQQVRATTIDCGKKSAFEPYAATKTAIQCDVGCQEIPFDETEEALARRTRASHDELLSKKNDKKVPPRVQQTHKVSPASRGSTECSSSSELTGPREAEKQMSVGHESKGTEATSASSTELSESLGAVWSDDSLRHEPSVHASRSLRIADSIHIDSMREARLLDAQPLSPILEDPYRCDIDDSPGASVERPLSWVQFETSWQEKEEGLMVDTAANHRRIELLHEGRRKAEGTTARVGVPIMLPFEDELMDRRNDRGLGVELEPNPYYWRSAPFLPRISDSNIDYHESTDSRGPTSAYNHDLHHRQHNSPSPSLLRRKDRSNSPPTATSRRKHVSWVDEI